MEKYKEIFKLAQMLEEAEADFDFHKLYDGYQIVVTCYDDTMISFVEHFGSYGMSRDLIEACVLPAWMSSHEPEGYLTAEKAFKFYKHKGNKHYDEFE